MVFSEFLKMLRRNRAQELVFVFEDRQIRKDYHISEVMTATIHSIDCGGVVDGWNETVLQLIEPGSEDGSRFMGVEKALNIIEKSSKLIDLAGDAKVILEFRPEGASAAQRYTVSNVVSESGKLIIQSAGATTQCKPAMKNQAGKADVSGCCSSSSAKEEPKTSCCG